MFSGNHKIKKTILQGGCPVMMIEPNGRPVGSFNVMSVTNRVKIHHIPIYLSVIVLALLLVACTPDRNDTFIQGSWYFNDPHIKEQVGESYEETIWTFDRGAYENHSCCFIKFQQFGRYDVIESEGDRIVLELFNINGKLNSERVQILITIDREAGTIRVLRGGPYTRMDP